jgi:FHS family L-fucose permease-like MFS transporter
MNTRNWFWNALFLLYVGVEVTIEVTWGVIGTYLIHYWTIISTIHVYVLGSLMIGRWLNAYRFNPSSQLKKILLIVVPYIALSGIGRNFWSRCNTVICLRIRDLFQIVGFFRKDQPSRTLMIFGLMGMTAMLIGLFTTEQ